MAYVIVNQLKLKNGKRIRLTQMEPEVLQKLSPDYPNRNPALISNGAPLEDIFAGPNVLTNGNLFNVRHYDPDNENAWDIEFQIWDEPIQTGVNPYSPNFPTPGGANRLFYSCSIIKDDETKQAMLAMLIFTDSSTAPVIATIGGTKTEKTRREWLYRYLTGSTITDDDDPWGDDSDPDDPQPDDPGGYPDPEANPDDPVTEPDLPGIGADTCGMLNIWNPTIAQLSAFSNWLISQFWQSSFFENFVKMWGKPIDSIICLNMVPFNPEGKGSAGLKFGGVDTGYTWEQIAQFHRIDCGTININEELHNYMDYAPYTRAAIYLPYIGMRNIPIDDITRENIGGDLKLTYHIDVLQGACVAYLIVNGRAIYQWNGNMAASIPFTFQDNTQMISTLANTGAAIAKLGAEVAAVAATGGAAAPMVGASMGADAMAVGGAPLNIVANKDGADVVGNMGSTLGFMGVQKPFIILHKPRLAEAGNIGKYISYPRARVCKLAELKGLTIIQSCPLDNLSCTEAEKDELFQFMKGGIYL